MTPIRAGDRVTDAMVAHIFDGVRARTLPKPEWTHPAHLVFATALLDREGLTGADAAAPRLIRAYNESVGGVNDDTQGYHHTITLFFLRAIDEFLEPFSGEGLGLRATRLLASPLAAPDFPLRHYSRERLFSVEARRGWLAPDLARMERGQTDD
ncbi:MAG: hypothetical protein ACK4NP_12280 [Parvularculaceae bacterium]